MRSNPQGVTELGEENVPKVLLQHDTHGQMDSEMLQNSAIFSSGDEGTVVTTQPFSGGGSLMTIAPNQIVPMQGVVHMRRVTTSATMVVHPPSVPMTAICPVCV